MNRQSKRCRYFRSMFDNKKCKILVDYSTVSIDTCYGEVGDNVPVCARYSPLDEEEQAELNEKRRQTTAFTIEALAVIGQLQGHAGTIDCPKCGEKLQWSRAYNGHVHGICSTSNCLRWMQ